MVVAIDRFSLNPVQTAGSFLLLISPFLPWFNVVSAVIVKRLLIAGFQAQSSLLDLAVHRSGIPISSAFGIAAEISLIASLAAGIAAFKNRLVSLVLGVVAIAGFAIYAYPLFGTFQNGSTYTYISPSTGLFVVGWGVILQPLSRWWSKGALSCLVKGLTKRSGLVTAGAFMVTISITVDGLTHFSAGELGAFFGAPGLEEILHRGLLVSIAGFLMTLGTKRPKVVQLFSLLMLVFTVGDGAYHLSESSFGAFIGHDSSEIVLHLSTYYGVAIAVIAQFLIPPRQVPMVASRQEEWGNPERSLNMYSSN